MIFVTGDIHGGVDISKLNSRNFPIQKTLTKKDYVIICGDFGAVWYPPENKKSREDAYWRKWLDTRNFTTLFVDGNHENFPLLNSYPIVKFKGGKAHKIADNIYHLMRGEIYNIEGKKFFCFGGASSHDIEYRVEGVSWWREEMPSMIEMEYGLKNLEKFGNMVDFVISHCSSGHIQDMFYDGYDKDGLTSYFDFIEGILQYKHWYFGHYHRDMIVDDKHTCLYDKVIRIL